MEFSAFSILIFGSCTAEKLMLRLPEFDFPSLDPLFYEYGRGSFNTGDIHGKVIASNVTCIGLSKTRLLDVRPSFLDDDFRLEVDGRVLKIFIEGVAKAQGSLSGFRMGGKDDLAVTFVNEYWPSLYRAALPVLSNGFDPWLTGISNSFFSKVSFSKIFL